MTKTVQILKIAFTVLVVLNFLGCSESDLEFSKTHTFEPEDLRIGFELIEVVTSDSILVWKNQDNLTQEQFNSIQTIHPWRKNQPREGMPDFGRFLRSPNTDQEGDFVINEYFGYDWLFNAQVIENNVSLPDNDKGLLTGRYIRKYHEVTFNEGRKLSVLIDPNGEEYILISRDSNRTTDIPLIPDNWKIEERLTSEKLTLILPNPTLNIRAENNQDSWQGPINTEF
jgi:hypothetical protein